MTGEIEFLTKLSEIDFTFFFFKPFHFGTLIAIYAK